MIQGVTLAGFLESMTLTGYRSYSDRTLGETLTRFWESVTLTGF